MPSGYTCQIEEGQSFQNYLLTCARAFGVCAHQRDYAHNVRPEKIVIDIHHQEALKKANQELARFKKLTTKQIKNKIARQYKKDVPYRKYTIENKNSLKAKYETMLKKVDAWKPPSSVFIKLKKFMKEQIVQTIEWDCDLTYVSEVTKLTVTKYRQVHKKILVRSVKYHKTAWAEEQASVKKQNKWIDKLYNSLD